MHRACSIPAASSHADKYRPRRVGHRGRHVASSFPSHAFIPRSVAAQTSRAQAGAVAECAELSSSKESDQAVKPHYRGDRNPFEPRRIPPFSLPGEGPIDASPGGAPGAQRDSRRDRPERHPRQDAVAPRGQCVQGRPGEVLKQVPLKALLTERNTGSFLAGARNMLREVNPCADIPTESGIGQHGCITGNCCRCSPTLPMEAFRCATLMSQSTPRIHHRPTIQFKICQHFSQCLQFGQNSRTRS